MKHYLHLLMPGLVLLIFGAALWLLFHQLRHFSYQDLMAGFSAIPLSRLLLAIGLTVVNYVILVNYDWLAVRYIGHPLSLARVALASFVGYVSSNNFGMLLGGSSVRYRLYSAWGLSSVEILELIAMLGLTFWIGVMSLAGLVFVIAPFPISPQFHLPFDGIRPLGIAFLIFVAGYLALTAFHRRPIRVGTWQLRLPPLRLAVLQLITSGADLLVAAGVFYVLLPADLGMDYPQVLGAYLLAIVVAVFTHVPGGLGVFELVMLFVLAPAEPRELVVTILVYRAIYYLLPLAVAAVVLGVNEVALQRETLGRLASRMGRLLPLVAPRLLAFLVFAAGTVLLFSGALPIAQERLGWVQRLLPLPVVEMSHFFGSLVGMLLLLLARGLQRRLDGAYWLTLGMLALGVVASLLKGFDVEEATVLLVMFAILWPARPFFYRKSSLLRQPLDGEHLVSVALVLIGSVWLGLLAHRHVEYSGELWWQFAFDASAPRFLRATVGATALLVAFAAYRLLRPAVPRPRPPTREDLATARQIAAASPNTHGALALLGDKMLLFNAPRTAMLMYGVRGQSWVAMGDPIGPADQRAELAWRFREMCDRYEAWPVFYQVGRDNLPIYLDLGLTLLKLGEEARVALAAFSLEGSSYRDLRQTVHRLTRDGCWLEVVPAEDVPPLLPSLRQISDAWLAAKNTREKGFSLGRFDEDYLRHFPAAVVRRNGRIVAFANLLEGADKEELSVDLMRHPPDAPDHVMEYLFVELMLWGKAHGYRWFNLGMAPLSGLTDDALAPIWNRVGVFLFRHGEHFYNFQGLRQFKGKFHPHWRPQYLASPGGLALPRILTDAATLIAGGFKGLITK
ncbi:MAG: bifunctional lysylphosphatidylglycerol flippase/synthetase MprF [Thermoguttaceae bacterium]|jgi:phosphatidylglycerol lysyltransferase